MSNKTTNKICSFVVLLDMRSINMHVRFLCRLEGAKIRGRCKTDDYNVAFLYVCVEQCSSGQPKAQQARTNSALPS